jgi:DedD protein
MDEHVKARLIGATILVVLAVLLVPEMLSGPKPSSDSSVVDTNGKRGTRSYTIDLGAATSEAARLGSAPASPTTTRTSTPALPTVAPPGAAADRSADVPEAVPPAPDSHASLPRSASTPESAAAGSVQAPNTGATSKPASPAAAVAASTPTTTTVPKPAPAVSAPSRDTSTKGSWAVQVGAFGSNDTARKLVSELDRNGYAAYVAPLNRSGKTLYRVRVGPVASRPDAEKLALRLKSRGTTGAVVAAD